MSATVLSVCSPPLPRTPVEWLRVFGPGAIVASLTIGTGELIFSSRGGSLFGYDILFLFVAIAVLKWGLMAATSRHMVLTGVHPYERMLALPGPRGWLPVMLLIMSVLCVPVWIAFHAGVTGNLIAWTTGTRQLLHGGIDYAWGMVVLLGVLWLVAVGGYIVLERVQLAIVGTLVLSAIISLILYRPDWTDLLTGVLPGKLSWPEWAVSKYPHVTKDSVWVEATRYVGVIGGGSFDYLAWTTWLRQKKWGALPGRLSENELQIVAGDPQHPVRQWLRAPIVDSVISFILIIVFSAVFVASGALILGPNEVVPDEKNLLNLQATFVTSLHPWLLPLYVTGALLTMIGTLYGTTEVGVAIVDEIQRSLSPDLSSQQSQDIKRLVVAWSGAVALLILSWLLIRQMSTESLPQTVSADAAASESVDVDPARIEKPRVLLALLTPVSLLTGVLACGLICWMNLWMDARFLPRELRMPTWLFGLNLLAGFIFLVIGCRGWWAGHRPDGEFFEQRWFPLAALIVMAILSTLIARSSQSTTQV